MGRIKSLRPSQLFSEFEASLDYVRTPPHPPPKKKELKGADRDRKQPTRWDEETEMQRKM